MASGDAAALAAYRSDPARARYQSWETPYPVDSARALIAEIREVRFAQPGAWLQVAIETAGRLIGDVAVRVDGDDPRQAEVGFTELNPKADQGQPTLFDTHRFHAFFTTSDLDTVTADQTHRRHAIIEQINADLKDSALAHLPSGVFTANAAWLVLVTIAFNL